jgi:hypothetical protein
VVEETMFQKRLRQKRALKNNLACGGKLHLSVVCERDAASGASGGKHPLTPTLSPGRTRRSWKKIYERDVEETTEDPHPLPRERGPDQTLLQKIYARCMKSQL